MPALAGANVIYGLGMVESGITFDFGQLVMDNEIAGMIKRVVEGIEVTDETLAVDVISEVGVGRHYLDHDDTYNNMRRLSSPRLIDRQTRDAFNRSGGKTMYENALEKAREILKTHKPPELPRTVRDEISGIIKETEARLGVGREDVVRTDGGRQRST